MCVILAIQVPSSIMKVHGLFTEPQPLDVFSLQGGAAVFWVDWIQDMRARSISRREQTLEEEHQAMREFLKGTEDEQPDSVFFVMQGLV